MVHEIHQPLSNFGKTLIQSLLNEGLEVAAFTETNNIDSEEWMFFGRNAQFTVSDQTLTSKEATWSIRDNVRAESIVTYCRADGKSLTVHVDTALLDNDDIGTYLVQHVEELQDNRSYRFHIASSRKKQTVEIALIEIK